MGANYRSYPVVFLRTTGGLARRRPARWLPKVASWQPGRPVSTNEIIFDRRQPGGLQPLRSEIASALRAAGPWALARDLPDPVGYADLAAQPDVFYEQLTERIRQGRFPIGATRFPLPKPGGTRRMTWLDPYDEIGLRVLVGRMTAMIKRACDRERVFSYPLASAGAGWSTLPYTATRRITAASMGSLCSTIHVAVLWVSSTSPSTTHPSTSTDARRFRRRFDAWDRFGVSAVLAVDDVEVTALCESRLERFPTVIVYRRPDLEVAGLEVVPTFGTPHVTLTHQDLETLVTVLLTCEHRVLENLHFE